MVALAMVVVVVVVADVVVAAVVVTVVAFAVDVEALSHSLQLLKQTAGSVFAPDFTVKCRFLCSPRPQLWSASTHACKVCFKYFEQVIKNHAAHLT